MFKKSFYILQICACLLLVNSVSVLSSEHKSVSFNFETAEGGSFSETAVMAFEAYMAEQQCPAHVVIDQADEASLFLFSARPAHKENTVKYQNFLNVVTYKDLPLTSAILVHASTGIDSLESLKDARVGYISNASYMGYEVPVRLFSDAGVVIDKKKVYLTSSHDGAIGLLLHKNIFAAVLAGPLAHRWAKANSLKIVAESEPLDIGRVLISKSADPELAERCHAALVNLKRATRSDKRMNVFPRWVEGFKSVR